MPVAGFNEYRREDAQRYNDRRWWLGLTWGDLFDKATDTYPDKTYSGEVVYIASEAEFTPKNVQTTEERVKLVYAVKVRITGDAGYELKPGLAADVTLRVRTR